MNIPLKVHAVVSDPNTEAQIVILKDEQNVELLPIWVGTTEGNAIRFALEGIVPQRPLTHDLLRDLLTHLGIQMERSSFMISTTIPISRPFIWRIGGHRSKKEQGPESLRSMPDRAMPLRWRFAPGFRSMSPKRFYERSLRRTWTSGLSGLNRKISAPTMREGPNRSSQYPRFNLSLDKRPIIV